MSLARLRVCLAFVLLASLAAPLSRGHTRHPPPTPEEIAWSRSALQIRATLKALKNAPPELPPAPAGVTDLSFAEIFSPVVGPLGLEYTAKIRALDRQRVRIAGYMVKQQSRLPGVFLFAPLPVSTDEFEYGLCDDLPSSTLHVFAAEHPDRPVPLRPGLCVLTGRIEIGPRAEADGRNSVARLYLDPAPPAAATSSTTSALAATAAPAAH